MSESVELRIWGLINRSQATLNLGDGIVIHTHNGRLLKIMVVALGDKRLPEEEIKEPSTWDAEPSETPNNIKIRCWRCRGEFVSSNPNTSEAVCPACNTKTLGYAGERKEDPNGG